MNRKTMLEQKLTENEKAARSMLLLHSQDPLSAMELLSATTEAHAQISENDPYATEDDFNQASVEALQNLGYMTDLESVGKQHDYLHKNHAGIWGGNYTIVDSENEVHSLLINEESVQLLLNGVDEVVNIPSEGEGYSQRTFDVDNKHVHLNCKITTSIDDLDPEDSGNLSEHANRFQVLLSGTLTIKKANSQREIKGKRGVSTPAGVFHDRGEEPPWIWAGEYQLRYTDTDLWEFHQEPLNVTYNSETKSLALSLGTLQASNVIYRNNVIGCRLELNKGVVTQVSIDLRATSSGSRQCYAFFQTTGQIRTLTGYARERLDHATLWNSPEPSRLATKASTTRIYDFCKTIYDSTFSAADLVRQNGNDGNQTPTALFASDTITVVKDGVEREVSGFRVDERDEDGNKTGRVAIYSSEEQARFFAPDAKLKAYQQLDEAGAPQAGLKFARVGVLASETKHWLPGLVETSFYQLRFSLADYKEINKEGLRIDMAIDDPDQANLLTLMQPDKATCPVSIDGGTGPDPDLEPAIDDYTMASVLVHITTGETQVVGRHNYYFSVRSKDGSGYFKATRTFFKPADGASFELDGPEAGEEVSVPILMYVPVQMGSEDGIELTGGDWIPAVRGKYYAASVAAMGGVQPFVWRILKDQIPPGLSWDETPEANTDIPESEGRVSFSLSGTVAPELDPGKTYNPLIRVLSDRSVIMTPGLANPQITIAEPETEGQTTHDVISTILALVGGLEALATFILAIVVFNKENKGDKQPERDQAIELTETGTNILEEMGSTLERATEMINQGAVADGRINELNDRIAAFDDATTRYQERITELESEIENNETLTTHEIERLRKERDHFKDKVREKKNEHNHEKKKKQTGEHHKKRRKEKHHE